MTGYAWALGGLFWALMWSKGVATGPLYEPVDL